MSFESKIAKIQQEVRRQEKQEERKNALAVSEANEALTRLQELAEESGISVLLGKAIKKLKGEASMAIHFPEYKREPKIPPDSIRYLLFWDIHHDTSIDDKNHWKYIMFELTNEGDIYFLNKTTHGAVNDLAWFGGDITMCTLDLREGQNPTITKTQWKADSSIIGDKIIEAITAPFSGYFDGSQMRLLSKTTLRTFDYYSHKTTRGWKI